MVYSPQLNQHLGVVLAKKMERSVQLDHSVCVCVCVCVCVVRKEVSRHHSAAAGGCFRNSPTSVCCYRTYSESDIPDYDGFCSSMCSQPQQRSQNIGGPQ